MWTKISKAIAFAIVALFAAFMLFAFVGNVLAQQQYRPQQRVHQQWQHQQPQFHPRRLPPQQWRHPPPVQRVIPQQHYVRRQRIVPFFVPPPVMQPPPVIVTIPMPASPMMQERLAEEYGVSPSDDRECEDACAPGESDEYEGE